MSVPSTPITVNTTEEVFKDGQEVWYNGIIRAYIVRQVARRINNEPTYKIKIGMRDEIVPRSAFTINPTEEAILKEPPVWPPTEVSAPKTSTRVSRKYIMLAD